MTTLANQLEKVPDVHIEQFDKHYDKFTNCTFYKVEKDMEEIIYTLKQHNYEPKDFELYQVEGDSEYEVPTFENSFLIK